MEQELYKENILDHYKNPRNHGRLDDATHKIHDANPLCGDEIDLFIVAKDGIIEKIRFAGRGCSISQAAASMLTEFIEGKSIKKATGMNKQDALSMLGIEIGPVRMKCALLAYTAMKKALAITGGADGTA